MAEKTETDKRLDLTGFEIESIGNQHDPLDAIEYYEDHDFTEEEVPKTRMDYHQLRTRIGELTIRIHRNRRMLREEEGSDYQLKQRKAILKDSQNEIEHLLKIIDACKEIIELTTWISNVSSFIVHSYHEEREGENLSRIKKWQEELDESYIFSKFNYSELYGSYFRLGLQ